MGKIPATCQGVHSAGGRFDLAARNCYEMTTGKLATQDSRSLRFVYTSFFAGSRSDKKYFQNILCPNLPYGFAVAKHVSNCDGK
jgi:hypothetical protein